MTLLAWWWVLAGALLVCNAVVLWMIINHLAKVDDLAHGLNHDLAKAEDAITELKAALAAVQARLPVRGQGGRFVAQADSDAQFYGKHAHAG